MSVSATIARDVSEPSIELEHLRKQFGDFTAVDGISLTVAQGEFLTLLGPSGCGKTTTLRMIGGFELPSSGVVKINGKTMGDLPPYKRPVNTVFQNYALFPHLTAGQNVGYGLEMAGVDKSERKRRVSDALAMMRLPHAEDRKPSELSGGQQQRVALARALVNRPSVLLLDEPLGALDLALRKAMQLELKQLNREVGATFIYVTHDQEEALTMSDRVAVMNGGRILQLGSPREIYERPVSRFVAGFIGQTNFLDGEVVEARDGVASFLLPDGVRITGRLTDASPRSGKASLAIRPEKVSIAEGDVNGELGNRNRLPGTIAEVIYLGTHTRCNVQLAGGGAIAVLRQNQELEAGDLAVGERVMVSFAPEAAVVLGD